MLLHLKTAKPMQTVKGFGASSCWWSQYCAPQSAAEEIAELLYGDSGLKLNIYRYNLGGGTDKDNCRVENPWRRTESFYQFDREAETGTYDFSADKTARGFMRRCLAKGNIDTLILFANSPHYALTSTGQASGSLLYHTCNLPKANYRKFADDVLTVTAQFLAEGLPVQYISPINEPQWKWGGSYVWQEGCHYETEELVEVFHIFAEEILKRGLPVKLYGPESGEMGGKTAEYLEALTADETVMQVLEVFSYHSYHDDDNPAARRTFKTELVEKHPELRFDMSEWCELPNKSHTRDFNGALITARIIGQDLLYGGAESWTAWVAVNQICRKEDNLDYSDGFLSASDDFSEWSVAERYYAMAHFSKYIPVGAKALDIGFFPEQSNRFNVFPFLTPQNETVLVTVNEADCAQSLILDGAFSEMTAVVSTAAEKCQTAYRGTFASEFTVPAKSIATVILK